MFLLDSGRIESGIADTGSLFSASYAISYETLTTINEFGLAPLLVKTSFARTFLINNNPI